MTDYNFGPTGQVVFDRTYSRPKPDGSKEDWGETVWRVVRGNLGLVHGEPEGWSDEVWDEAHTLEAAMLNFDIIPAGRHLWATGVKGRQYLFNCHSSHWTDTLSDHMEFSFLRLMEGGGVGSNYSSRYLKNFHVVRDLEVHIVCDPEHPDYLEMREAGVLSDEYDSDWEGAFMVDDSREGWAEALVDLLDTYTTTAKVAHHKRVYDVTNVRRKGARLKTFGGTASGPTPFAKMMLEVQRAMNKASDFGFTPITAMDIDHAVAECVVSGGNRRSARMSILAWDDPFIDEFIEGKRDAGKWWTTNISVEINDDFFTALEVGDSRAAKVYMDVVRGMLTNGEPGIWNSSLSNEGEVNEVVTTNPCGEIALEPWENCNLGHVNLGNFADRTDEELLEAHRLMTRFVMRATYGDVNDEKQAETLARNRRIGVGHFGVQTFLNLMGIKYSEAPSIPLVRILLDAMYKTVRAEARSYAFELRIPEPVKVTTVAPTGTIAKLPGTTEGIHPIYARHFIRRVRFSLADEDQAKQVVEARWQGLNTEQDQYDASGNTWIVEYPTKDLLVQQVEDAGIDPSVVESVDEISLEDMLDFQKMYQTYYADNAVSFTVNVPATQEQWQAIYEGAEVPAPRESYVEDVAHRMLPYLEHLKGTTLMVDGTRPQAPYERITQEQYESYGLNLVADGTDEDCGSACPVR